MGWGSCATLQAMIKRPGPATAHQKVAWADWVPRGRPKAGHCTCSFYATLHTRQLQVVLPLPLLAWP